MLPLGLFLLTNPAVSQLGACDCNCYFDTDCGAVRWFCDTKANCTPAGDPVGKLDGVCILPPQYETLDLITYSTALGLLLEAFESAGASGGGPPDPVLVATALSLDLPEEQHEDIRRLAVHIQLSYLGLDFFTPPSLSEDCAEALPNGDHGVIAPLALFQLDVGALIRQAVVGELQSPGQGIFQSLMSLIPIVAPQYETPGRCEFPHPPEHDHPFPFVDGLDCLETQLSETVQVLLELPVPEDDQGEDEDEDINRKRSRRRSPPTHLWGPQ